MGYIAIVAGLIVLLSGVIQVRLTWRNEVLEQAFRQSVPSVLLALEGSKEYTIYKWDFNDEVQVKLKLESSDYKAEVIGRGSTLIEAAAAALAAKKRDDGH